MTFKRLLFVMTIAPTLNFGTSIGPYAGHRVLVDNVLACVRAPATESTALRVLEAIALGKAAAIEPQAERDLRLPSASFRDPGFASAIVRERAVQRLGETGKKEALNFLKEFKIEYVGANDPGYQIWPAVQVAIRAAQLVGIAGKEERRQFLETVVDEDDHSDTSTAVKHWAVNQLCDAGLTTSLPVAVKWLRSAYIGEDAEKEVEDCEARIRIVSSNSDRAKALGSVLQTGPSASQRLIRWAMNQLESLDTPDAAAELKRFADEVGVLPPERLEASDSRFPN
jgi:hypothetical protein